MTAPVVPDGTLCNRCTCQTNHTLWRGLYLQTVLAALSENEEVLGCAMHEPFVPKPAAAREARRERWTVTNLSCRFTGSWFP